MTVESTEIEATQRHRRRQWLQLLLVAGLIASLRLFVFDLYATPGLSMHPTLQTTDVVLVEKAWAHLGWIGAGDVVVLADPLWDDRFDPNRSEEDPVPLIIKRVVATEGQTVEGIDGELLVDGVVVEEPYVGQGVALEDFGPVTVQTGHVFVLGDKRNYSTDSRVFGDVPLSAIQSRAILRVWPVSRLGGL